MTLMFSFPRSNKDEFPSFHFETMQEFVEVLSSFPQVKETLIEGNDIYGLNIKYLIIK